MIYMMKIMIKSSLMNKRFFFKTLKEIKINKFNKFLRNKKRKMVKKNSLYLKN